MCAYLDLHSLTPYSIIKISPCVITLNPPFLLCFNVQLKHIHQSFSLCFDTDVLNYIINISREANYEHFVFKRLYGFSKQFFNYPALSVQIQTSLEERKQGSADSEMRVSPVYSALIRWFYNVKVKFL